MNDPMTNTTNFSQRAVRRGGVTSARRARLLLILGVALALLGGLPAASYAATAVSSFAIGPPFGSNGGLGQPAYGGVAVGQSTGNIFIPQQNQASVDAFASDPGSGGTLLTTARFDSIGIYPLNVAVDPGNGALYVSDTTYSVGIAKAVSDGAPTPAYTVDFGFAPAGLLGPGALAVDPVTHDLLAIDSSSKRVFRLSSSTGATISSFDGSDTSGGAFQAPSSVAVGPTGTIYVVDMAGARVERFSAAGTSIDALPMPDAAQPTSVAVNPQNGNIAVLLHRGNQVYIQGYTAAGAQTFAARITPVVTGLGASSAIAWDGGTGRIYVSDGNGNARAFLPALQPGVDPPVATPGRNTVHLTADVDPGGDDTTARFEYCPASAACGSYPVSNPADPANPWQRGPDHTGLTTNGPITDDLPLGSNASWRVRVSANDNVTGTDTTSSTVTFDSPLLTPGVTTGSAGSVTASEAELTGTIDTLGAQATYHFEYGLTTNYGSRVPAAFESPAGDNRTPRTVTKGIAGLQSGSTYHYRLVADNSAGENVGGDRTFTTAGPDDVAPHRGYEQVTPADKHGAQINSTFHVQAATDGSAIAVATVSSGPDDGAARIFQNYLSRRGASDWLDWRQIDAPQDVAQGLIESSTAAVSGDFEHALVVSNRALAPGGIVDGGNIYVRDLQSGEYTFVAGAPGNDAYQNLVAIQKNETIYIAGAPDFSWILFWGRSPFLPEATGGTAIYRWTRTSGLTIESRLPTTNAVLPAPVQLPQSGTHKTFPSASTDGDVIGFSIDGGGGAYRRADGHTTAISVSHIAGDPPDTQPALFNELTPDGRYAFFQSPVRLSDDTPADLGGAFALYRYDAVTNGLRFVAIVTRPAQAVYGVGNDGQTVFFDTGSETDVWRSGQVRTVTTDIPVRALIGPRTYVTANGRFFAFVAGDEQVYRYDAQIDQLVCVSCPSDGSPGKPAGLLNPGRGIGNRATRAVTESGETFFDTASPLVTADHNGTKDVYAYTDRPTLISPGDGTFDATFVDASDDGSSIFFQTDEGIVSRDTDESVDVYVARVGGGFTGQSPPPSPARCVRAECGELGSGPAAGPPASSSTTGAGTGLPRTNQEKAVLSLGKVSFGSKSVRVTFRASERGRVRVTGSRVATTVRNVAKAGSYAVSVPLSMKARALVRAHKKFKVSLKVSLSGGWGSASAKYSRTIGN
jgi:hypothetical protein